MFNYDRGFNSQICKRSTEPDNKLNRKNDFYDNLASRFILILT